MENDSSLEVFNTIISALKQIDNESQKRTLQTVITFLGLNPNYSPNHLNDRKDMMDNNSESSRDISFSENRNITPKEFLRQKSPQTDTERIACLAYYLTTYRDQPHFKTLDLSSLNTEAAQPKLSNPTVAVDNATKQGLLVQAGKGNKQMSSAGEIFVQELPDREAARASIANMRIKKRSKKSSPKINANATTAEVNSENN